LLIINLNAPQLLLQITYKQTHFRFGLHNFIDEPRKKQ